MRPPSSKMLLTNSPYAMTQSVFDRPPTKQSRTSVMDRERSVGSQSKCGQIQPGGSGSFDNTRNILLMTPSKEQLLRRDGSKTRLHGTVQAPSKKK